MSEIFCIKPLGEILQLADLISIAQIEFALQEQIQNKNMRLGEILALQGWIKQETADFFAQKWSDLLNQKSKQPLGEYLKKAGLLDEYQVKTILCEQKQMGLRFGELAVHKGWLKPTTINFFLEHIAPVAQRSEKILQQAEHSVEVRNGRVSSYALCARFANREFKIRLRKFAPSGNQRSYPSEGEPHQVLASFGTPVHLSRKVCPATPDASTGGTLRSFDRRKPPLKLLLARRWRDFAGNPPTGLSSATHWLPSDSAGLSRDWLNFGQNAKFQIEDFTQPSPVSINDSLRQVETFLEQDKSSVVDHRVDTRPLSRSIIKLFNLDQKASRPDILLEEVLSWTSGQPFLTQKLCQLLADSETFVPFGEEGFTVEQLVQTRLIEHWETQVASEHLKAIRYGLLQNKKCNHFSLLKLYQQILYQENISVENSFVKTELLNLGLVVEQGNKLKVSNRIYQSIFPLSWVNQEIIRLDINRSRIKFFKLDEKASRPYVLLEEVLLWTSGQLFLTQKLCQLLANSQSFIPVNQEAVRVEQLVQTRLIDNWEIQVASEHLEGIRNGILKNQQCQPLSLLQLYQQILQHKEVVVNNNPAQRELLNLGLVVKQEKTLKVSNRIYQSVFSLNWVNQELDKQSPPLSQIMKSIQNQLPPPTLRLKKIKKTISNRRKTLPKETWILLGTISLMLVGFTVVGFSAVKSSEVQILFQQGDK